MIIYISVTHLSLVIICWSTISVVCCSKSALMLSNTTPNSTKRKYICMCMQCPSHPRDAEILPSTYPRGTEVFLIYQLTGTTLRIHTIRYSKFTLFIITTDVLYFVPTQYGTNMFTTWQPPRYDKYINVIVALYITSSVWPSHEHNIYPKKIRSYY